MLHRPSSSSSSFSCGNPLTRASLVEAKSDPQINIDDNDNISQALWFSELLTGGATIFSIFLFLLAFYQMSCAGIFLAAFSNVEMGFYQLQSEVKLEDDVERFRSKSKLWVCVFTSLL